MGEWKLRDHAWFIAFAPYDDPRYAVSVLVEHGGFGASSSGPRARELLRIALLKDPEIRAKIEKPLPLPETLPKRPRRRRSSGSADRKPSTSPTCALDSAA